MSRIARTARGTKRTGQRIRHPLVNDPRQLWVGERVRLLPMPENDVGEEFGIVEEFEGDMFVVTVEAEYLEDENDDGLREVPTEYVELAPR